MIFVPHVPPTRSLTPRARDLSDRIAQAVDEFRRYYPDTTEADIRAALAATGSSYVPPRRLVAGAALAAGLVALGVVAMVARGGSSPEMPLIGIAAAAAAAVAILVRLSRRG